MLLISITKQRRRKNGHESNNNSGTAGLGAAQALRANLYRKPRKDSSLDTLLPGWREGPDREAILTAFEAGKGMIAEQAAAYALGVRVD